MSQSDLKTLLSELKNIQPNKDWAVSARTDLISHIDSSEANLQAKKLTPNASPSWFERTLAQPKWAGAFTLGIFALMIVTASAAQNSIPGSPLYGVKIASEDLRSVVTFGELEDVVLQAKYAERRVDEVNKIASGKLEIKEAEGLREALESYKNEIALAKETGDREQIEKSVASTNEKIGVLTNIMNESDPEGTLENIGALLLACGDEKLKAEAEALLESGEWIDEITAYITLTRCEPPVEDEAGTEGEETVVEDFTDSN